MPPLLDHPELSLESLDAILQAERLVKHFPVQRSFIEKLFTREREFVRAVDGIDLEISRGDVFGLVGESGSGKTTTGRLAIGLVKPTDGRVRFNGQDIAALESESLRHLRKKMQIIFQDPYASLNPRMKVGDAIADALKIHGIRDGSQLRESVLDMMKRVGLTPPEVLAEKFPHQLSGGQRQRVVIARALILKPEFVVADEPIAMVDVSVRALILDLMLELKQEFGLTYLFITHDLATAKYVCNKIAVMYLGRIVESAPAEELFESPLHPYTMALLSAIPVPDPRAKRERIIPRGEIPNPINPPSGCRFHPRCPFVMEKCRSVDPEYKEIKTGHFVACHLVG